MQGSARAAAEPAAMKRIMTLAAALFLFLAVAPPARTLAQTPSNSPKPVETPSKVYIVNHASSFFPAVDQQTGVWQGCGPARDDGMLEDFNHAHPRARIVQVFIDASIPCKAPGSHAFVIVYQDESHVVRRSVRYPMAR